MEKWGLKNSAQTLSFTLNSRFALLALQVKAGK
jgi:hypothetical protein